MIAPALHGNRAHQSQLYPILKLALLYWISFLSVYLGLSLPIRLLVMGMFVVFQLKSYKDATIIMFLVIFIPFYKSFFRAVDIDGLLPSRVLFLIYLYLSLKQPIIRRFPFSKWALGMIIISIISLKFSSEILYTIQDVPLKGAVMGLKNKLISYYDLSISLCFFYFAFTRLSLKDLNELFRALMIFVLFESITVLYQVYENPQLVMDYGVTSLGEDWKKVLWQNPYFGHKNDWGLMLGFMVLAAFIRLELDKNAKKLYLWTIAFALMAVAVSLSRQAYVWTVVGVIIITIGTRNSKLMGYFLVGAAILLILQPEFLIRRMDSMISVEDSGDFQDLNRKVSDQALEQAKDNFQLIPRMFFTNWQYNYSEGFWNGMLHQEGILGFVFHMILYMVLFIRYFKFYSSKNKKLSLYGLLGLLFIMLLFFANFNRRHTHFLHYNGQLTQINRMNLFILCYIELVYYAFKNRLRDFKYL